MAGLSTLKLYCQQNGLEDSWWVSADGQMFEEAMRAEDAQALYDQGYTDVWVVNWAEYEADPAPWQQVDPPLAANQPGTIASGAASQPVQTAAGGQGPSPEQRDYILNNELATLENLREMSPEMATGLIAGHQKKLKQKVYIQYGSMAAILVLFLGGGLITHCSMSASKVRGYYERTMEMWADWKSRHGNFETIGKVGTPLKDYLRQVRSSSGQKVVVITSATSYPQTSYSLTIDSGDGDETVTYQTPGLHYARAFVPGSGDRKLELILLSENVAVADGQTNAILPADQYEHFKVVKQEWRVLKPNVMRWEKVEPGPEPTLLSGLKTWVKPKPKPKPVVNERKPEAVAKKRKEDETKAMAILEKPKEKEPDVEPVDPMAIVLVEGDKTTGNGFICKIKGKTFLITNIHVLGRNKLFKVLDSSGKLLKPGGNVFMSAKRNIAMLPMASPAHSLEILEGELGFKEGEKLSVPMLRGNGEETRFVHGSARDIRDDQVQLALSFRAEQTGCPLIDPKSNQVFGVATYDEFPAAVKNLSRNSNFRKQVRQIGYRLDTETNWQSVTVKDLSKMYESFDAYVESTRALTYVIMTLKGSITKITKHTDDPEIGDAITQFNEGMNWKVKDSPANKDRIGRLKKRLQLALSGGSSKLRKQCRIGYLHEHIDFYDGVREQLLGKLDEINM